MQYQEKHGKKSYDHFLQEKKGHPDFIDGRIRVSKDFTFYGVTQTKSGEPEISLALKIILASGEQLIFQYHELISPMRYNGADKITLATTTMNIVITGMRLENIIDYLAEHRLVWIKEPDSDFVKVDAGETYVERIEVNSIN